MLLVHVPPLSVPVNVFDVDIHIVDAPDITGRAFTVIIMDAGVPQPFEKYIVAVPAEMPFTMPDVKPTVATLVLALLQVPEGVTSVNVVVEPIHTGAVPPLIAAGAAVTVTVAVVDAEHPPTMLLAVITFVVVVVTVVGL